MNDIQVVITGVFDEPIVMFFENFMQACNFMLTEEHQYLERGLKVIVLEHGFDVKGVLISYQYRFN